MTVFFKKLLLACVIFLWVFQVSATEYEPNDINPQSINFGENIVGQLSSEEDIDKFSVVASTAGTLTLSFSSDDFDNEGWVVEILDSLDNVLSSSECSRHQCTDGISIPNGISSAGTYIVNVKAGDGGLGGYASGLYSLSVAYSLQTEGVEIEPNDINPQSINSAESIVGQLSSEDDIDKFSVVASTAGTLTLSFSSDDHSTDAVSYTHLTLPTKA